jgi:hypothetical protein
LLDESRGRARQLDRRTATAALACGESLSSATAALLAVIQVTHWASEGWTGRGYVIVRAAGRLTDVGLSLRALGFVPSPVAGVKNVGARAAQRRLSVASYFVAIAFLACGSAASFEVLERRRRARAALAQRTGAGGTMSGGGREEEADVGVSSGDRGGDDDGTGGGRGGVAPSPLRLPSDSLLVRESSARDRPMATTMAPTIEWWTEPPVRRLLMTQGWLSALAYGVIPSVYARSCARYERASHYVALSSTLALALAPVGKLATAARPCSVAGGARSVLCTSSVASACAALIVLCVTPAAPLTWSRSDFRRTFTHSRSSSRSSAAIPWFRGTFSRRRLRSHAPTIAPPASV